MQTPRTFHIASYSLIRPCLGIVQFLAELKLAFGGFEQLCQGCSQYSAFGHKTEKRNFNAGYVDEIFSHTENIDSGVTQYGLIEAF